MYSSPAPPISVPSCVYHPVKSNPALVTVGNVTTPSVYDAVNVASVNPYVYVDVSALKFATSEHVHPVNVIGFTSSSDAGVPPCPSNVTVIVFGVGSAITFVVSYSCVYSLLASPSYVPPFAFIVSFVLTFV